MKRACVGTVFVLALSLVTLHASGAFPAPAHFPASSPTLAPPQVQTVSQAKTPAEIFEPADLLARLDALMIPYVQARDFAGVVLIAEGDNVLVRRAYGYADIEAKSPVETDMAFRIASLSKTFTAAAIEMLIDEGKLRLTDPLAKFVPNFPFGDKISIRDLLLHRSGVADLSDPTLLTTCHSTAELAARLKKEKPLFEPATGSGRYSNTGYVLLARVVEIVSGSSYADFLAKRVFRPLGMERTATMCLDWGGLPHPRGHYAGGAAGVTPLPFDQAGWDGPGSIVSTADDLLVWLQALATDRLGRFHALEYPYGWGKRNYSGRELIEQSGELRGFFSHMALYSGPRNLCFVVLSNVESGFFNRIPAALEAVLFGGGAPAPPEVPEKSARWETLRGFAGAYKNPDIPEPARIEWKDGRLWTHWGDDPFWKPLVFAGGQTLFLRAEYASIRILTDKSGAVIGSSWTWGDNPPLQFKKIEAKTP